MEDQIVVPETIPQTDIVSTEQTKQESTTAETLVDKVDEFKLPTSKEEYETLVKAAVNKEKTNFLKELGVKSVKEYREQVSKATEALSKHDELIKQKEDIIKEKETISQQYESLKQTSVLDKLGVKAEYREDLLKLAKDKVNAENSFESVLKGMVEGKYQYTINKGTVKVGAEKTTQTSDTSTSSELHKKYSWIK